MCSATAWSLRSNSIIRYQPSESARGADVDKPVGAGQEPPFSCGRAERAVGRAPRVWILLTPLEFERPILELEAKIEELRQLSSSDDLNIADEVGDLQAKAERELRQLYAKLAPWQKVQVARHPNRPHTNDYVGALIEEFTPLAGDRLYGDDPSIVGGIGRFRGRSVIVLGHEKGHDTESRVRHNFGMAHPEGDRKSVV